MHGRLTMAEIAAINDTAENGAVAAASKILATK
jgi:hypothetical protein